MGKKEQTIEEIQFFFNKTSLWLNEIPGIEALDKVPENEAAGAARGKDIHL